MTPADLWNAVGPIFAADDGSLPELDVVGLDADGVERVFECLRKDETREFPDSQYLWVNDPGAARPLRLVERPAAEVLSGRAESFHCTLVDVTVGSVRLPELGVLVTPDLISVDYRMGPQWNEQTVAALLSRLVECGPSSSRIVVGDAWTGDLGTALRRASTRSLGHYEPEARTSDAPGRNDLEDARRAFDSPELGPAYGAGEESFDISDATGGVDATWP